MVEALPVEVGISTVAVVILSCIARVLGQFGGAIQSQPALKTQIEYACKFAAAQCSIERIQSKRG